MELIPKLALLKMLKRFYRRLERAPLPTMREVLWMDVIQHDIGAIIHKEEGDHNE